MTQKIIIDTDIGCDCDDAGALAVAHALQYQGKCNLIAMSHCTSRVDGCSTIEAINRYYGASDIPIGIYRPDGFLDEADRVCYSRYIQTHFENHFHEKAVCPDANQVLRKALAEAEPGNVSLVGIGPMVNLSALLNSQGDQISPLSGRELIKEKQCPLICMAACFEKELYSYLEEDAEWNVKQAIPEAQNVFENWPTQVFVVPFETGYDIITGMSLEQTTEQNPVLISYQQFGVTGRSSWDPCCVHFAVTRSSEFWEVSETGTVTILDNGESVFHPCSSGPHRIVWPKNKAAITESLEGLMGWMPQNLFIVSKSMV